MLMNYSRACNPYSGFSAPVNGTSTIGYAEKALFSGFSRHVLHYELRIKDGRKIDPPYNTGNDFIYEDDFSQSAADYADNSGQTDEEGNRLVQNNESNGRFHTDWLNMIYPRLKLAKDLLSEDGVIFISIDEKESANLDCRNHPLKSLTVCSG